MRYLKTSEAALLLNVSPNTLRAWERRFSFPSPQRSPGKHRLFTYGEVAALREALQAGLSISSAVSQARERLCTDTSSVAGALACFDRERADAAIEGTLALRPLERTVTEVLLPTLERIAQRPGPESAQWAFAAEWGAEWLHRARRLAPPPGRPEAILLGDASRGALDPDAAAIQGLELFLLRAGIRVLSLSVRGLSGVGEAAHMHQPDLVVIAGGHLDDDSIARWAYSVRVAVGPLPVALYRRGAPRASMRTTGVAVLPSCPLSASRLLPELIQPPDVPLIKPAITAREDLKSTEAPASAELPVVHATV